jgi:hypothetical protein
VAAVVLMLFGAPGQLCAQDAPDTQDPHMAGPPSQLVLRAFGSVQWGQPEGPDSPNSFTLGQLDLFATSTLSERISVLAEIVFEGGTDTRVVTDLERLQLTYLFNDYLSVSAGRYHTGIGFYNNAFHHGAYFETVIGRPRVFAFEDEGGVLPVHEVGVSAQGAIPGTGSRLYYLAEVGNGRPWGAIEGEDGEGPKADLNSAKAVNFRFSFRPERWRGFDAGGSLYLDTIPSDTVGPVTHRISAAFATYRTPTIELMAEWLMLTHDTGAVSYRNDGGYVQASKSWGKWRPYYRYDRLSIESGTPFLGAIESSTTHVIGVRLEPSEWVGLKAQYERGVLGSQRGIDGFRSELVFVF